jgi:hypothetical protein
MQQIDSRHAAITRLPYSQRLRPRSAAAAVDSKQHVLFECLATKDARALVVGCAG